MKRPIPRSILGKLDDTKQNLEKKLYQATSTGMSQQVIDQLHQHIAANELSLSDEMAMEAHRQYMKDNKGPLDI